MIYNRNIGSQVIGSLFKKPERMSDIENYLLTLDDFPERLPRMVFGHMYNLYHSGLKILDIPTFIKEIEKYPEQNEFFKNNNGQEFVATSIEKAEIENFDFYYDRLKKHSLLRDLDAGGFDITAWYIEGLYSVKEREILEAKLNDATVDDILQSVQQKILDIEGKFINKSSFKISNVAEGIETLVERLSKETAVGLPLNGSVLSSLVLGARVGKVYSMSGEQGAGKSRYAIANACKMAFPILWNKKSGKWENSGSNQKVMLVTTELMDDEVQSFVLAFISGVPEDRILNGTLAKDEKIRISQTINIMKHYQENFQIFQLPDPNVNQIKVNLRRYAINYQLDAVFYDYIHTSPSLLSEFAGARIREDVALMLLSTALKEIANEQKLFIWTGTQVNGTIEAGKFADVGVVRGSKAIMDKVDAGMILRKAQAEDLQIIAAITQQKGETPSHSIDIFKNRRGKHNKVRLWIDLDLGTGYSRELFLTDSYGVPIEDITIVEGRDMSAIVDDIYKILDSKENDTESVEKKIQITL